METAKETATDPGVGSEVLGKREVRASVEGFNHTVSLERGNHRWQLDEPASAGGNDFGPTPVNAFLGALSGCMLITLQMVAEKREVPLTRIAARTIANPNRQVESVRLELDVWSAASQETWDGLLERAERGCYVSRVLRSEIEYEIELMVHAS